MNARAVGAERSGHSGSPSGKRESSGDENTPVVNITPENDPSAPIELGVSSQTKPHSAISAPDPATGRSKPLETLAPAPEQQVTLKSAAPVFRDPVGSAWGQADTAKAIRSLSSCPSSLSKNGSQSLGHEALFSAGLFKAADWKVHTSFRRWLPEPLYLYVSSLSSRSACTRITYRQSLHRQGRVLVAKGRSMFRNRGSKLQNQ